MTASTTLKKKLNDNLNLVRDNIARACERAKRDPSNVTLIAVTKTVEVDTIRALIELGQTELGESRVQDLIRRHAMVEEYLRRREKPEQGQPQLVHPRWHMIGHVQRNKVKQMLPLIRAIHSVDSLRLAEEVNTAAARLGFNDKVPVFLQVNTSEEKQKYGLAVGAVGPLAEQVETLPNIKIVGLMTMAPLTDDPQIARFCFTRLREIFEELVGRKIVGPHCRHLSMGMSQDYEIAVEEGATMLRVGTALFQGIFE